MLVLLSLGGLAAGAGWLAGSPRRHAVPMSSYAASLAANGIAAVRDWTHRVRDVRELARRLVNAPSADDVFFVPSTTHGIGRVTARHV